ncbi:MAG: FAD-dependent oxidoreductase [Synergistaceae bacterium]|nr:FAD-dependent oxidoreductase [Synergistaceae bacterium]MBQ3694906.1 FAD-dependent oxidoreductase [Synergistaceae bacterium]MBQ6111300.1 FAD-dependent oxidoreductase [Synergistaceae bacterium]MBQ9628029.1 FAD-dependent oxidoreductase [Synergistaceae bacterium]MBR0250607.1 FAD-dependent oxidoreductase [Synergistaceae bacterium]
MSRLSIMSETKAQAAVDALHNDLERRVKAAPPDICPLDVASSYLKVCSAQTCGKCVPCRVGLPQMERLIDDLLDGNGDMNTVNLIEKTAESVASSADCAIGYEAANMVLKGLKGFRDDYEAHAKHNHCAAEGFRAVPCVTLCPAHVDIPGYIALVNAGRYADAVRLIRKDNPFPSVCAMVCEHPCENKCRRRMVDDAINIRGLKLYAIDHAGHVPVYREGEKPAPATGKKVAIIGGGPSGISAAYYLGMMGHSVEIFEQRKRLGGMLRYGIPSYRLPREILHEEIETLLTAGDIKVHKEVSVGGPDFPLKKLRDEFDAVYIAIGAHTDKSLKIPGEDAEGVMSAVELLRRIGDDDYPDFRGKKVVVVGGGNVAMDCARSSLRLNADKVTLAYRRRKDDMTALAEEVEATEVEGCEILELAAPLKVEAEDGKAKALWVKQQMISNIKSGRPAPKDASAEPIRIEADIIVVAIGQGIDSHNFEEAGIAVKWGCIEAFDSEQVKGVNMEGVFSGGDCVSGPATVIRAIAAGKVAAANIDEYLGYHHPIEIPVEIPEPVPHNRPACGRVKMRERPITERIHDFKLVEKGMSQEEMEQESNRCLRCDYYGFGKFREGREFKW